MPFSAGIYTVAIDFATEAGSPPIEIAKLDQQMQDIATALSTCILRDGTGTPTAGINWGSQDLAAVNSVTIGNANDDTIVLNLTRAGSKIVIARSSDGSQRYIIGSDSVGGSSLSLLNTGGVTAEVKIGGGTLAFATNAIDRLVCDGFGKWTFSGTTTGATPTITVGSDIAITAGGSHSAGIAFTTATRFGVFCGSGVPTITVAKGSLYLRSDGGSTNTRLYVATDATGTWTAVITQA